MKKFDEYYEQFFDKEQRELFDKGIYGVDFQRPLGSEKPLAADASATTKKYYNQRTIGMNSIYEDCIFDDCAFEHMDVDSRGGYISRFYNCIFRNCSIMFNWADIKLDNCLFFNCDFRFNCFNIYFSGKVGFFYNRFLHNKFDTGFNDFIQNIKGECNSFKTHPGSINTNEFSFDTTFFVNYPYLCTKYNIPNKEVDAVKTFNQRVEKFKQEHKEFWAAVHPHVIPNSGKFYGYKALYNQFRTGLVIAKLLIPESARKVNGFGTKCRADAAIVKDMWDFETGAKVTEGRSLYDNNFKYYKDEIVHPDEKFDDRDFIDCGAGIHFFMTKEEAEEYGQFYTGL